ncbi:MAG: hypothetical protein AAF600_20905 [Bacteroidota bacterium]
MKNLIYSICIVSVLFACSDDPDVENLTPELTVEALVDNQNFIDLLNAQQTLTESFAIKMEGISDEQREQYLQTLDKLMTEDNPESEEKIAQMLGFNSAMEYSDTQNKILTSAKRLTEQFPTIQYNNQTEQIFAEATTHLNYQKQFNINSRVAGNCGDKLSNCRNKADATLALATAGCVSSVFIPVAGPFIGVGCEAAALYNHYTDYEKCNLDYEDCAQ